jgi:hypothetical protein
MFSTGGRDKAVRVYDEETLEVVSKLEAGYGPSARGHTNRVFCTKWCDTDPFVLLSGGWDRCVHVWDTRSGRSERVMFGPEICGDALDVRNGVVLTGACVPKDPLELWDLGTAKRIRTIDWKLGKVSGSKPCMVYSAAFSKDPAGYLVAAGGSISNEARLFDRSRGDAHLGTAAGFGGPVFAVAWHDASRLAIAGSDGSVRLLAVSGAPDESGSALTAHGMVAEEESKAHASSAAASLSTPSHIAVHESTAEERPGAHPGSPQKSVKGEEASAAEPEDEWGVEGTGDAEAEEMLAEARASASASSVSGPVPAGSGAQAARQLRAHGHAADDGSKEDE